MDCFNKVTQRSKVPERFGRKYGFPMAGKCVINDRCKVGAIREFFKTQDIDDVVQYIGIAADEPKRLKRIDGTRKVSLLAKYNYTEQMARELCERYDLLSPVYSFTSRGGVGFVRTHTTTSCGTYERNTPNYGDSFLNWRTKKILTAQYGTH